MITVEFTQAEAQAVADAVRAYIDDDYYPAIDLAALRAAYERLTLTVGNPEAKGEVNTARTAPAPAGHSGEVRPCSARIPGGTIDHCAGEEPGGDDHASRGRL